MAEKRSNKRQPKKEDIRFHIIGDEASGNNLPSPEIPAKLTDISETGMGLSLQTPLKPGQFIKFLGRKSDGNLPDMGVVMWTTESAEGVRAGIKLIHEKN